MTWASPLVRWGPLESSERGGQVWLRFEQDPFSCPWRTGVSGIKASRKTLRRLGAYQGVRSASTLAIQGPTQIMPLFYYKVITM